MKQIMLNTVFARPILMASALLVMASCQVPETGAPNKTSLTVGDTPSDARTKDGLYISWREHLIDDQQTNGGTAIRGGDGLAVADLDGDGFLEASATALRLGWKSVWRASARADAGSTAGVAILARAWMRLSAAVPIDSRASLPPARRSQAALCFGPSASTFAPAWA